MHKTGVLLLNLGTPDACDTHAIYRYLTHFLNDKRVIDLPSIVRFLLVNGLIIPFRLKKTLTAYLQIWTSQGSPLLVHTENLKNAVISQLGEYYQVEIGMRYGNPSIDFALKNLKNCEHIICLPLFPQYASATTGSALEKSLQILTSKPTMPAITTFTSFYDHPGFIASYAQHIQEKVNLTEIDLLVFSYHGLPEKHITQSGCMAHCDHLHACPPIHQTNVNCYRAQCYSTSQQLAKALSLTKDQYTVAFQSRLGRLPWIKPYIDEYLPQLIQKNIKNIAIACPSFVTDCLETLEEINIRLRKQWQTLGGNQFVFIPCLNDYPEWVKTLADIIKNVSK